MKEKISRKVILSPFIFMIVIFVGVMISNNIYNNYEYLQNRIFGTKLLSESIEKHGPDIFLEKALAKQKEFHSKTAKNRVLYNISISIVVLLLTSIFFYSVFRYFIFHLKKYQKDIFQEKENLEKAKEELQYVNQKLSYQLYIDTLTQIENRLALERDLLLMSEPKMILLDIDSFKDMNEYYGSSSGDFILQEIASTLKGFAQEHKSKVYRTGADEFALLEDTEYMDIERYEEIAISLVELFKGKQIVIPSHEEAVEINVAIGFSLESTDVYEKASMALNEAKKREIDYLCYFKKIERTTRYAEQIKWSKFIQEAIQNDTVIPYFQPIFDSNKKIVKYECLVRMLNEQEEVIPPGFFLGISKKVKRYVDIEKILIDKSFKEISGTDTIISLNLLARDMSDSNISNYVVERLKYYNVANQVIFEILEDESIESLERVATFIDRVKRMGCKIAIDDFGTGYSNFSYLLKLKPDYIKIDGSLIKDLDKNENSIAIVTAIIAFAKKLHIKTIAEYVHSEAIYELCQKIGIDEFQGFYLGEPSAVLKGA